MTAQSPDALPEGFHTVTAYLIVDDIGRVLDFVADVFDGEVLERLEGPDGNLRHIGDSRVMLGGASDEFPAQHAMLYVYVEDTDATYERALEEGATSVQEPEDMFYGDRNAGVEGPCGIYWWIATHTDDVSPEEIARRARESWDH